MEEKQQLILLQVRPPKEIQQLKLIKLNYSSSCLRFAT